MLKVEGRVGAVNLTHEGLSSVTVKMDDDAPLILSAPFSVALKLAEGMGKRVAVTVEALPEVSNAPA